MLTVRVLRLDGVLGPDWQREPLLVYRVDLELVEVARAEAVDLGAEAVRGGLEKQGIFTKMKVTINVFFLKKINSRPPL